MATQTDVLDCGHELSIDLTTGKRDTPAIDQEGRTYCYACALARELSAVASSVPGDHYTAYVSSDGRLITTWTGAPLMRVQRWGGQHAFSAERQYVRAVDVQGRIWSGTGAAGMWASLKLTKQVISA